MISSAETKTPLTAAATTAEDTSRAKNLALALLVVTQFVIVIDGSIVNVALPSIGAHLPHPDPAPRRRPPSRHRTHEGL